MNCLNCKYLFQTPRYTDNHGLVEVVVMYDCCTKRDRNVFRNNLGESLTQGNPTCTGEKDES